MVYGFSPLKSLISDILIQAVTILHTVVNAARSTRLFWYATKHVVARTTKHVVARTTQHVVARTTQHVVARTTKYILFQVKNCWGFVFCYGSTALVGLCLLTEVSRSRSDTPHSVGLLWTRDQPVAETST
jgi:hypothetical protein